MGGGVTCGIPRTKRAAVGFYDNLKNALQSLGINSQFLPSNLNEYKNIYNRFHRRTGRLILVAIPKVEIDETVYTVMYFGGKGDTRVPIKIGEKIMHNMSEVINILYDQSKEKTFEELDRFECVMPLTPAFALNPYSGIKYFVFDTEPKSAHEEKELQEEKHRFVNAIILKLKASGNFEKSQKIAKDFLKKMKDIERSKK